MMTDSQIEALNRMNMEGNARVDEDDRDAMEERGWIKVAADGLCSITTAGTCALEEAGDYVVVHDDFAWGDDDACQREDECAAARERMEDYLTEHEPEHISISVRHNRPGECAGTYYVRANGSLQILGFSLPVPELVQDLVNRAWQHACETWE